MRLEDFNLPDSLKQKIDAVERRLLGMETLVAVCGGLFGFFLVYLLIFGLDRFHDTSLLLRWVLTLSGAVIFGLFAFIWMRHWVFQRRNARDMAKLVGKRHEVLGDRLLGVVELAEGDEIEGGASPQLVQAAIDQVAREAETMDFGTAVSRRGPLGWGLAFGTVLVTVLGAFLLAPSAAKNALSRMVTDEDRYTFTSIHELRDVLKVPHGEAVRLNIGIDPNSEWIPETGSIQIDDQPRIRTNVANGKVAFDIPPQIKPTTFSVKIGDDSKTAKLLPLQRPVLGSLTARIAYPDYLEREPTDLNVLGRGGKVEILEGSRFVFQGRLKNDRFEGQEPSPRAMVAAQSGIVATKGQRPAWSRLKLESGGFKSAEYQVQDLHEKRLEFTWQDEHDLTAASSYGVRVKGLQDGVPVVTLSGINRTVSILESEILSIDVTARDDFGLQNLWLEWQSVQDPEKGIDESFGSELLMEGASDRVQLTGAYEFSPLAEGIQVGSIIEMKASSVDYYPGRAKTTSLQYLIYVLSKADHAAALQREMENLQAEMEEVARDEEQLIEENKNMLRNPQDMKPSKLAAQEFAERAQKQRMERMAEDAEKIVEEARKNDEIGSDTKQEWSELSEGMKDLAKKELSEASKALGKASQSNNSSEQKEQTEKAVEEQEKALAKMREMEKKANQSIENMQAQNFINRLKERAKEEKSISQRLQVIAPQAFGARKSDLPEEVASQFELLAAKQLYTRREASYIQNDLIGFFNRTKKQPYRDIHDEMTELDMNGKLEKLADDINDNHTSEALGLTGGKNNVNWWEAKFLEWAGIVEEEKKKNEDQEQQEQQEMEQEMLDILYALLRARGSEERIRSKTRSLEEILEAEYGEPEPSEDSESKAPDGDDEEAGARD